MVSLCSKEPCASRQTILQPGSTPMTRFCPKGGASRSCLRFPEKTRIASSSAFSLLKAENSVSMEGFRSRLYASRTASPTWRLHSLLPRTYICSSRPAHSSSSGLILTFNRPSDSPRRIASRRWEEQRFKGSLKSK